MEHCSPTKCRGFAPLTILLTAVLAASSGCRAQLCNVPDNIAHAVNQFCLTQRINNACGCEPMPREVFEPSCQVECDYTIEDYTIEAEEEWEVDTGEVYGRVLPSFRERVAQRLYVEVGPPPVPYKPPMPPQFLPVPSQPVFSKENTLALVSTQDAVEIDSQANIP